MDGIRRFLGLLILHHSASSFEITAARLGSDARVPCLITVNNPPVDPEHLTIFWFYHNKVILRYNRTVRTTSSRYSLSTEALGDGIANLMISNIRIPDGGMYKCSVTYSSERKDKEVRLDIGAPPQVKITNKTVIMNEKSVLSCSVTGFYPIDIDIRWFRGTERMRDVITENPLSNPDKTYNINSSVTLTPSKEDREKPFSCRVHHEFLLEPLQETFHLEYEEGTSAGIIAVCVIVPLLVFLIAGAVWWTRKRRMKALGSLIMGDIEGPPKLIDGEEATLTCTIDNCSKNLNMTWWIRRSGQDKEIQTSQMRGHSEEEEESLLDTSYVIRSKREGCQYITSLIFIPHIERHRDVTFICRVVSGQHKEEKMFSCETVYAKPQMSEPIDITITDPSRVQFSLNLQKFYPKDITISWHWENTNDKYKLSAQQTFTTQDDLIHDATSVLQISDSFKDQEMKIIVEWEHQSMAMPERRSLGIRDLPWRPLVGFIKVPKLENKTKATMTCDISGYFPDLLSITWFIKKDGNLTALPIESSETEKTYKISHKGKRQKDNTYSCEALLTFTPKISSDQGSEIICRVDHPSLEGPIERSTGPLHIDEKSPDLIERFPQSFKGKVPSFTANKKTEEDEQVVEEIAEEVTEDTGAKDVQEPKDVILDVHDS